MLNPECTTTNVPISITSKPLLNSDCWMAIYRVHNLHRSKAWWTNTNKTKGSTIVRIAQRIWPSGVSIFQNFVKFTVFGGPSHACTDCVKFGMRQSTVARIVHAKFHPHRRNVREEKPHYRPMSSLNIGVCSVGGYPVNKIRGYIRARLIRWFPSSRCQ